MTTSTPPNADHVEPGACDPNGVINTYAPPSGRRRAGCSARSRHHPHDRRPAKVTVSTRALSQDPSRPAASCDDGQQPERIDDGRQQPERVGQQRVSQQPVDGQQRVTHPCSGRHTANTPSESSTQRQHCRGELERKQARPERHEARHAKAAATSHTLPHAEWRRRAKSCPHHTAPNARERQAPNKPDGLAERQQRIVKTSVRSPTCRPSQIGPSRGFLHRSTHSRRVTSRSSLGSRSGGSRPLFTSPRSSGLRAPSDLVERATGIEPA